MAYLLELTIIHRDFKILVRYGNQLSKVNFHKDFWKMISAMSNIYIVENIIT
jgi:hypothetical protein